jgi:hypothetical protein
MNSNRRADNRGSQFIDLQHLLIFPLNPMARSQPNDCRVSSSSSAFSALSAVTAFLFRIPKILFSKEKKKPGLLWLQNPAKDPAAVLRHAEGVR